jgi:hypothetical protein
VSLGMGARARNSQGQPADSRRDDRHDEVAGKFFHEQIQETGLHRLQRGLEVRSSLLNMVLHETPGITKGSERRMIGG